MRANALFVAMLLAVAPLPGVAQDWDLNRERQLAEGFLAQMTGDYAAALQALVPLAEQGNDFAQSLLGELYANGQGVLQNYAEAVRLYRLAAEQGFARAQFNLGLAYANGHGVLQDYAEAVRWYRAAAEQGYARAQFNLGLAYANGHGVLQDYILAHVWFNIAASNGNETAADDRETVADKMTPTDVSEAQRRARVCVDSDYQDCD